MNKKLVSLISAGALALAASGVQASPTATAVPSGLLGGSWSYAGPGTLIDMSGDTVRSYSSGSGVTIFAEDCCAGGDAFGLIFDGIATPWTTSGFSGTYYGASLFQGWYNAPSGSHTWSFEVTADCCGSGGMQWELTTTAPVPEPETYAMMLAGLGLLGFAARRRKQQPA